MNSVLIPGDCGSTGPLTVTGTVSVSGLQIAGRISVVSIDNLTWTALPAIALVNRNSIALQNESGQEIKVGYVDTEPGYIGMTIPDKGERGYDIKDTIILYAKSSTSACQVTVEELS